MTDTHDAFRQISDLLQADHSQTAWNLFTQVLREAYEAGYDAGEQDMEENYTTNPHFPED